MRALGSFDVGQAAAVRDGVVGAVEAVEGTDAALRRAAALCGRGLVVAKAAKPGQDLRFVTAEALRHYRNLLLANTAPGQADLLDVPADEYERIRAQATKFTPPELSRIIALLLAAQTDMRWTTSPRLTLELALVRASMPESDPTPESLISRLERLERLAGVDSGAAGAVPPSGAAGLPPRRPVRLT